MKIEIITNRSGIYGGLRRLYQVAQYLQEAGHLVVVNIADRSANKWFAHSIPENKLINPDVRIVPEVLQELHPTAKNILYYQAHWDSPENKYDAVITTSTFLQKHLTSFDYPSQIINYGFDSTFFTPNASVREPGLIAYMPRKNDEEATTVKQLLPGYKFLAIDGMSEKEVVACLQRADIFLAISRLEGFGCPPVEAALCGALVVGYHGQGGKNWMNPSTYLPAQDPVDMAMKVKEAIATRKYETIRQNARDVLIQNYNLAQEKEQWLRVLSQLA